MSEEDVGITEFIGNNETFLCTFKHRMTDFIVEEIDLAGNVCRHNPDFKAGVLIRITGHR